MRQPLSSLLLAIACALPVLPLRADNVLPRKDLQAAYATYDKAAKEGMTGMQKWCGENLAPDFSMVFLDGNKLSRKEYLDMMQRLIATPAPAWKNIKSQKTRIQKLAADAENIVATVEIETTYETKNPKHRTISLERPYKETWTKVGDAWKVKRSEELTPKPVQEQKRNEGSRRPNTQMPRGGMPRSPYPGARPGYPNP